MTDQQDPELDIYDNEDVRDRLTWELPEIIAVTILVAFSLVVVGGLLAGILEARNLSQPEFSGGNQVLGEAIQTGSGWADPLLSISLLAVIGLCWWQSRRWTEPHADDDIELISDNSEAFARARRMRRIALWTQPALLVAAAGGIASLVGAIVLETALSSPNSSVSQISVAPGADCLAVLVIVGAGLLCSWRLLRNDPLFQDRDPLYPR